MGNLFLFFIYNPFIAIENNKYHFTFKRTRFSIRVHFTITLNKFQGQTLNYIDIYDLREPVFSHAHEIKYGIRKNSGKINKFK